MTITDIEALDREYLIPTEVAQILGCEPYAINVQAKQAPEALGFPVCRLGSRVKIPRLAFLRWLRYGNAPVIEEERETAN